MLGLNIWLVPYIGVPDGYMGSAWAALISYFLVMLLSYFLGRHYYPIPYEVRRICSYTAIAGVFFLAGEMIYIFCPLWLTYCLRTILLIIYVGIIASFEKIPLLSDALSRLKSLA